MIWDQELDKKDREDCANTESRKMGEFAKMASGIISCLKFTWDIPPDSGGGMPVLDTCCWIGEEERIEGIDPAIVPDKYKHLIITKHSKLKKVIMFPFFKKPMANRTSNRSNTAMPETMRCSMTSAEIQRRCRNTSRDLPPEILEKTLARYMDELKAGGYPLSWRRMILETGIKAT